jgi:hypothetical protein
LPSRETWAPPVTISGDYSREAERAIKRPDSEVCIIVARALVVVPNASPRSRGRDEARVSAHRAATRSGRRGASLQQQNVANGLVQCRWDVPGDRNTVLP